MRTAAATMLRGRRNPSIARTPASRIDTIPAPSRGWVVSENFTKSDPRGAQELINWLPTDRGARVRKGKDKWATLGGAVTALLRYDDGTETLFGCTADSIYDITAPSDPDVAPTADVSSLTGGDWIGEQITTSGGTYLVCVNGADDMRQYDGTNWTTINSGSSPAITGVATADLTFAWKYASRLFFVEKDTMSAWYLPTVSIAGAASEFPLGAVFSLGGSLLFGSSWSTDSGEGPEDRCVFVTDQGEVAVYAGSDPSSALDFALVGVFRVGKPLGKRAWMRAGGDIVIATEDGFVPLSQAVMRDEAALGFSAISAPIQPEWRKRAEARQAEWHVAKSQVGQWALVATDDDNLVVNTQTGAWGRWTGWDITAMAEFDNGVVFGEGSAVYVAETTGSDDGASYECALATAYNHLGSASYYKQIHMVRATFVAQTSFAAKVSISRDYAINFPSPPNAVSTVGVSVFGTMQFGTATFYAAADRTVTTQWRSVLGNARVVSAQVQITCDDSVEPAVELASVDVLHDVGGSVV